MAALPISKRAMPIAVFEEDTERTVVLNGVSFQVKNTFIDSESSESEENHGNCRKLRRAQTCTGKFVDFAAALQIEQSPDASKPPIPHAQTHACDFLLDDNAKFASMSTSCTFSVTLKNTFIEVQIAEHGEVDAEVNVHHSGVHTCKACFASSSFLEIDDTISTDASNSDFNSDYSDVECFESTPFDDSPLGDAPARAFFPHVQYGAVRTTLNLVCALPPMASTATCSSTTKTCCHWKNKGFCKLGMTCKFAHPAHKQGVGLAQPKKKHQPSIPATMEPQGTRTNCDSAVPPPPHEDKSDKVCCHWKNKGFCKYQSACKFQHPSHKQGIGCTKRLRVPVHCGYMISSSLDLA
jgi:hypothetical protein